MIEKVCPACGRPMVRISSWYECSNRVCDYEEDAEEVTEDETEKR
jgi:hypothetical protein